MSSRNLFITFSSALLVGIFAANCSRPVTCAVEGCVKDDKVVLKSDSQPAKDTSADAKADTTKADLEKLIDELKSRVNLNDSIDTLQNDMLHLHETRLAALELKDKEIDTAIAGINSTLVEHKAAIDANALEIARVESSLTEMIEAAKAKAASDLCEKAMSLMSKIRQLRSDMVNGDASVRSDLQGQIDALIGQITTAIGPLELGEGGSSLAAQLAALQTKQNNQYKELDRRVKTLEIFAIAQTAINLVVQGQIVGLQSQISSLSTRLGKVEVRLTAAEGKITAVEALVSGLSTSIGSIQGTVNGLTTKVNLLLATDVLQSAAILQIIGDLDALKTKYNSQVPALLASVGSINEAIEDLENAPSSSCTLSSEKYECTGSGHGCGSKTYYRDLVCGNKSAQVLVIKD